ncbi:MAG: tetraacyldisaccharide 4'-kinase [Desulfobulbaceae bacterium]|nr:tetraacyldisaccharide 4'-kinase [Desulfobulbaceae bacterium]
MFDNRSLNTLFLLGRIFSPLYSFVMRLRAALYARGVLPSTRLPVRVISVGNLTMGGTGKTPMVIYLCRLLAKHRRVGIVSRGYGGKSRQPINLVSDGKEIYQSPLEVGDEPVLLAQALPGVSVVTSKKRARGGEYLAKHGLADLLILDDGFQHLALQRDLDLVLFAAHAPVQSMWVFPGGWLREPHSALLRSDCFVLTGMESGVYSKTAPFRAWLQESFPKTPIFEGRYEPVRLYRSGGEEARVDSLLDTPLFAFCGIGNPQSFLQTLEQTFSIRGWQAFADHHPFSREDIDSLVAQALAIGCSGLITTEKDFVKMQDLELPLPLWILAVELQMGPEFDQFVLDRISGRSPLSIR